MRATWIAALGLEVQVVLNYTLFSATWEGSREIFLAPHTAPGGPKDPVGLVYASEEVDDEARGLRHPAYGAFRFLRPGSWDR